MNRTHYSFLLKKSWLLWTCWPWAGHCTDCHTSTVSMLVALYQQVTSRMYHRVCGNVSRQQAVVNMLTSHLGFVLVDSLTEDITADLLSVLSEAIWRWSVYIPVKDPIYWWICFNPQSHVVNLFFEHSVYFERDHLTRIFMHDFRYLQDKCVLCRHVLE